MSNVIDFDTHRQIVTANTAYQLVGAREDLELLQEELDYVRSLAAHLNDYQVFTQEQRDRHALLTSWLEQALVVLEKTLKDLNLGVTP